MMKHRISVLLIPAFALLALLGAPKAAVADPSDGCYCSPTLYSHYVSGSSSGSYNCESAASGNEFNLASFAQFQCTHGTCFLQYEETASCEPWYYGFTAYGRMYYECSICPE